MDTMKEASSQEAVTLVLEAAAETLIEMVALAEDTWILDVMIGIKVAMVPRKATVLETGHA